MEEKDIENFTSNFSYIKRCNKDELAELLTGLVVTLCELLAGDYMPDEDISIHKEAMLKWLDTPIVEGKYLN